MTPKSTSDQTEPAADPRPLDQLLALMLGSDPEDDAYWDAISIIQHRGTSEVLNRACGLGRSACPLERQAGAAILGQLGVKWGAESVFKIERLTALLAMLSLETDDAVLAAVLFALGHLKRAEAIAPVLGHQHHESADVRYAVVHALLGYTDERAVAGLIELSHDVDSDVRDWATFGLGSLIDLDTPALRQALVDRLDDPDGDTRVEAMVGLGRLRDPRVLPSLRADLAAGCAGPMELEAATLLGAPELLPVLIALRGCEDVNATDLEAAIDACRLVITS